MNNAANRLTVITMTCNNCNYRAALLPEHRYIVKLATPDDPDSGALFERVGNRWYLYAFWDDDLIRLHVPASYVKCVFADFVHRA